MALVICSWWSALCLRSRRPNQVLVKVHAAGICGSDVHVYHGSNPYAKYPVVLGQ